MTSHNIKLLSYRIPISLYKLTYNTGTSNKKSFLTLSTGLSTGLYTKIYIMDLNSWTLFYSGHSNNNNKMILRILQPSTSTKDFTSQDLQSIGSIFSSGDNGRFLIGAKDSELPSGATQSIRYFFVYPKTLIVNSNSYFFDNYLLNNFPTCNEHYLFIQLNFFEKGRDDGFLVYFPMNYDSGPYIIPDVSGNDYHGTKSKVKG